MVARFHLSDDVVLLAVVIVDVLATPRALVDRAWLLWLTAVLLSICRRWRVVTTLIVALIVASRLVVDGLLTVARAATGPARKRIWVLALAATATSSDAAAVDERG